jgi:UDP-glucose 4-epimerase
VATHKGKVLVTGGAGFIGSNIAEELVSSDDDVRVVDNLSTGRIENILPFIDSIEFIDGDLCDPHVARHACSDVDCVYHTAALPSVPVSMERPADTTKHGVLATVNLLTAAKDSGIRRLVFSSSSSVYGGEGPFPQREDATPRPRNPYAASKVCCETYVKTFAEAFGLDAVSLRYFNVFGPRQAIDSQYAAVFPAFISRMLQGEAPVIYGDGLQSRDFTYVSDVVRANLRAGRSERRFSGEVVNVAAGRETNLLELVSLLSAILGTDLEPIHEPERPGDTRRSLGDTRRALELLGHVSAVEVDEGLRRTVRYWTRGTTVPQPAGMCGEA